MSTDITHLRCSQLPEAFVCPGSARPASVRISIDNDASDMGTAAHKAMEQIVRGWDGDALDIVTSFTGDKKELGILVAYGRKAWQELSATRLAGTSAPMREVYLSSEIAPGVVLDGHPDLWSTVGRVVYVDDWKFGRVDRDYYHQLAGYAFLVFNEDPSVDIVVGSVIWMRDQEKESYTLTRATIAEWAETVRREIVGWDGVYHPGKACQFCPRSHECEAVTALARRDVAMFSAEGDTILANLSTLPDVQLSALRRRAKLVASFVESLDKASRAEIKARGGSIDCGDGFEQAFVEENGRRVVDTLKAWPLLSERFEPEEMAQFVDIRATALDELVAAKAPKGKGAAAKRAIREELEKADAIRQPKIEKLKERRKE